ncbi:uncharacterized protein EI90DRAFT_596937 [Cantharellus anzutake]|uniref:uncharacterized protein n=1 Tax=Cantharellus anzutake TaxID=1750568 RepID=UPI001902EA6D|nr:uncharacterized protein EI90DRAFT_596937 [Cantharellus anzutake]KAF8313300.1 hypothetical protein EI90DRAFT_596937 [Cantharellus anzutake]
MKSAPRQYRAPSGTPTLKPRRSSAVAGVSEIFGVAVNSPLPNSAASTLRSSPLRHEIYRDDSTSSTNIEDGMSVSSRKRGRDDEIASVTSIQFGIEEPLSPTFSAADSNKKSRLKDLDTTEALTSELIPEPIPIPSVPVSEDASAPSSAPIRWFGSLSRKISRPNVSFFY